MGRRRDADRISEPVDTGLAELVPDPDRSGSWTLLLDGVPQSHVDLTDPTHLEFEYVRRLAAAIDLVAPAGAPLRVLHLGGGALTLPRYVAATRPGSTQRVVEVDGALVDLVRRTLPWRADPRLKVRVGDARTVLASGREASYDLVVADVFAGARTPARLTSVEYAAEAARVLHPAGWYLANVADGPPLRHARAQVATVRAVLPRACLVADAAVLRGRRYGNLVLVAGRQDPPVAALARRAAGDWFPGRVLAEAELDRFTGGAVVVHDGSAVDSTPPPPGIFPSDVDPFGAAFRTSQQPCPWGTAFCPGTSEVCMHALAVGWQGDRVRVDWMSARSQSRPTTSTRGVDSRPAARQNSPVTPRPTPGRHQASTTEAAHSDQLVRTLYAEHAGPLLMFVMRLTGGDRQRAEDIVQETLLRAWRNAHRLGAQGQGSLRPWLVTVARRIAIDEHRSEQARPAETYDRDLTAFAEADSTDRVLRSMTVADALRTLSQSHREILVATYFRGRTVPEAAEELGLPLGTAKSRVYYALRALRTALQERGVTE